MDFIIVYWYNLRVKERFGAGQKHLLFSSKGWASGSFQRVIRNHYTLRIRKPTSGGIIVRVVYSLPGMTRALLSPYSFVARQNGFQKVNVFALGFGVGQGGTSQHLQTNDSKSR
jgi:hypothetical protein